MPEVLYLSSAKLRRWPQRTTKRATFLRRGTAEVGGGVIPAKIGIAPDTSATDVVTSFDAEYQHLKRVLAELNNSDRFPRWVTDPRAGPGEYVEFDGLMQYGRVRRDIGPQEPSSPSSNIVFFVGAFGDGPQSEPTVDVLLGGWIGHVVEHREMLGHTLRMGSNTEALYDLWDELAEDERRGNFDPPDVWRRLAREPRHTAPETLASLSGAVYKMMMMHLPQTQSAQLKGVAQVLARLDDPSQDRPLLIGTPLVVEFSQPK